MFYSNKYIVFWLQNVAIFKIIANLKYLYQPQLRNLRKLSQFIQLNRCPFWNLKIEKFIKTIQTYLIVFGNNTGEMQSKYN